MKAPLQTLLTTALRNLPAGTLPADLDLSVNGPMVELERTRDVAHGDFACNIAMKLAKAARSNPRKLAELIVAALPTSDLLAKADIAGPGFINLHLSPAAYAQEIGRMLDEGERYGRTTAGSRGKVLLEFVSANPTGPLHVGHGRQAALGDALATLMQSQGYDVTREFYYNDAGVQIQTLATSVQARLRGFKPGDAEWPEAAYNGDYIADIASDFKAGKTVRAMDGQPVTASGHVEDFDNIKQFAVTYLRHEQDLDLQSFGLAFDIYYLESSLYTDGKVDAAVKGLIDSGKTYEQDGALWLKTTDFGDDKDRVMRKSDGSYTYFVPDVAYHVTKWQRGFHRAINIQGSDHHSTVIRVRAGLQALNISLNKGSPIPQGYPDYVLHKMVKVMRGGEEVKISKRAGSYVTVRDLIEWVGRDAVRFFLVSRRADTEFVFDVDLALSQSEENPVYYVQYAHARVCSVFRQLAEKQLYHDTAQGSANMQLLNTPHELALIRRLCSFPELLDAAVTALEPHQIAHYLRELAGDFHTYYNAHKFVVDDAALRNARLNLVAATRQVIANGLALLGVSAPEKMTKTEAA